MSFIKNLNKTNFEIHQQCFSMDDVSKGPTETLQSQQASMAGGHRSLRSFEASCEFLHISVSKGFEGRSMSAFGLE